LKNADELLENEYQTLKDNISDRKQRIAKMENEDVEMKKCVEKCGF
jgi:hypothetical protein